MRKYLDNKLFLVLLILPFFNPTAFKFIPGLTALYQAVQYWKLLAILVIAFIYISNYRFSKIIRAIIVFEAVLLISSLINGVSLTEPFLNALLAIGISMLTEMAIKINFDKFRNTYFTLSLIAIVLNFILCLIYPNGLPAATLYDNKSNPMYLLTIDNGMIKELLPLLVFAYYPYCKGACRNNSGDNKKLIFFICCIISLWTLSIVASATGLIVCIFFVLVSLIFMLLPDKKLPVKFILSLMALFMLFVVVIGSNFAVMDTLMGLFGRSGTFTGRTTLWRLAVDKILRKPLLGYGYTSGNIAIWGGFYSSHNLFLEVTIQGGIVLLAAFLYLIRTAFKNLKKSATPYFNIIALGLISYLIVGLMETGIDTFFYVLLIMAFNPVLTDKKEALVADRLVATGDSSQIMELK